MANFDPRLKHPFRLICTGASGTGKTTFFDAVIRDIEKTTTIESLDKLIICYSVYQDLYKNWVSKAGQCIFHKGLPSKKELEDLLGGDSQKRTLIVIDDLDGNEGNETLRLLFTVFSHHYGCSVLYCQHHLFSGQKGVILTRNANYLVLMPNPRDKAAIRTLAYQTHPENTRFLQDAYQKAVDHAGMLVCDFTRDTPEEYRYREGLTRPVAYYVPEEKEDKKKTKTIK